MKNNSSLRHLTLGVLAAATTFTSIRANAQLNLDIFGIFGRREEPRRERRYQPETWEQRQRREQMERRQQQQQRQVDPWASQRGQPLDITPAQREQPRLNTEGMTAKEKEQAIIGEFRSQPASGQRIRVSRTEWTEEDENVFGMFVQQMGEAVKAGKCSTVKGCMKSQTANMFIHTDAPGLIMYSDCADFPYFARAYVAQKLELPFGIVAGLELLKAPVASEANREDDLAESLQNGRLDNSPYGNVATSRGGNNIPAKAGQGRHIEQYLESIFDVVSTRTFRVGPMNPSRVTLDTYPVKMNKDGIKVGTIIHSTGHIGLVFDVDRNGTIHFIDAHPDGSLTYKIIKPSTLDRSRPEHGLGFYRFRNMRAVGGQQTYDGEIYGARVVPESNEELIAAGKYSLEQYFGINSMVAPTSSVSPVAWKSAFNSTGFFDYLGQNLRGQGVWIEADEAVVRLMDSLCTEMQQRVKDVEVAINAGTHRLPHPNALPVNIFSTDDQTWEQQSSPGRDGRMRASVNDIARAATNQWSLVKGKGTGVRFRGGNNVAYRDTLRRELREMDNKCQVTYVKSDGRRQTLRFSDVLLRLNKMSFDPYHCAEKRWGASGEELASCRDTDRGNEWYNAQTQMRNYQGKVTQNERLVIRSTQPITIDMLLSSAYIDQPENSPINLGYSRAPLMNLDGFLASDRFLQSLQ